MSKPRKKYNPTKGLNLELQALTKNIVLTSRLDVSEGRVRVWDKFLKKPFKPTPSQYNLLHKNQFKWSLILVVWALESNGKERKVAQLVKSPCYAYHDELTNSLNNFHQDMLAKEKSKGNQLLNAGWIAIPYNFGSLTAEQEEKVIDSYLPYLDYLQ